MRNVIFYLFSFVLLATSCDFKLPEKKAKPPKKETAKPVTFDAIPINYFQTKADSTVIDTFFGRRVHDPFRWLEADHSEEVKSWVKQQNALTNSYLTQIPFRDKIKSRLEQVCNYERYTTPFKEGTSYYFFKNDGLQNQSILYAQRDLGGPATEVLNPNTFSADGTAALGAYSFSKNGNYLAYQVSEGGSDWRTIYVKDLTNGKQLEDKVEWVKFSDIAWSADGFFYSRYPTPPDGDKLKGSNEFQQVYYHKIGTAQAEDDLVFADRSNPSLGFGATTTKDERYMVLNMWQSTSGNGLYFKDLRDENAIFKPIVEAIEDDYVLVDNVDNNLLVLTNSQADNWRLIQVNTNNPEPRFWEEIILENDQDVLQSVNLIDGKLVATYIHDASSKVLVFDLNGKLIGEIKLPELGTVGEFSGEKTGATAFFSFQSYLRPTTIYKVDMRTLETEVYQAPKMDFAASNYETKQIFYESNDGTKIPMFITHKKGLKLDGKRPTLLYGYGGFDISILPRFQAQRTIILENDGIYAVANIRGGGEYGKKWHEAGTKLKKQNVFNDFQAAADYLIKTRHTSSEKLAIEGRSNGGLLVGACITQRPDLYAVAFPAVGVLDMLRYHQFTIGAAWAGDYGRADDNEKMFDYLRHYSPVHNVEMAKYPATMVTTADHDDRVVPAHSFKFISELQGHQKSDKPVLIRIETNAGHGAGKSTTKQIEENADMLAFLFYNMKEKY